MYKLQKDPLTGNVNMVKVVGEEKYIPFDPANTDYQAYLAWCAEGNEPEPAEDVNGN